MKNASLQVVRAVAAVLVVCMHGLSVSAAYSGSAIVNSIGVSFQRFGHFGVDLFFVLSGLVISTIAIRPTHRGKAPIAQSANFLWRRAVRIYPLFWASLIGMLLVSPLAGTDNSLSALRDQPLAVILLDVPRADPVAWTLTYEIQFYAVAAVLMLFGRRTKPAFLVWVAVNICIVALARTGLGPKFALTDSLSMEFCLGILVGLFGPRLKAPWPWLWIGLAGVIVIGSGVEIGPSLAFNTPLRALVWGIAASLTVWAALSMEQKGVTWPAWLVEMGDVSYSIYMWHLVVFSLAVKLFSVLTGIGGTFLFLSLSAVGIAVISTFSFYFLEKKLMGWGSMEASTKSTFAL
jgi:exopolysaccharide production protein ExoZ